MPYSPSHPAGLQASHEGTVLAELYYSIANLPEAQPIRLSGVYTDGGADLNLWQFRVDNMCAPGR